MIIFLFLYPFIFKPSSFYRLTGSPDLNFFSSIPLYPSLLPFFENNLLLYFDYRKPYGIDEWKEINFSGGLKRSLLISILQKNLPNYSETEINLSLSKKFLKNFSLSLSLDYLLLNSIIKKENKFDFDFSLSFVHQIFIISSNLKHLLNSFDSKNYYFSLNFSPFDKFNVFLSMERENKKIGFYLFLKPVIVIFSFSENFMNKGLGICFEDKSILFSFEDNLYLGISTGVSLEIKK